MRRLHLIGMACILMLLCVGCMGSGGTPTQTSESPGSPSTSPPPGTPPTPATATGGFSLDFEDPTRNETWQIANESDLDDSGEHIYKIWNGQNSTQRVTITVWQNESVALHRTASLPPEGSVMILVYRVGNYVVELDAAGGASQAFAAPTTWDCNEHWFDALLRSDGTWAVRQGQTALLCGTTVG